MYTFILYANGGIKMKKIFATIFLIMLLVSCSSAPNSSGNPPAVETQQMTIKDYFPSTENVRAKYQGIGNEYAEKEVFVDYVKNDRVQLRVITPGTILAQVYEIKNGELKLITSREEFYYREDLTQVENTNGEIILKEPLVKGTSWTLADGRKRHISNVDVEVTTPSGKYKALEVTTEGNDSSTLDYYAANIGLVKSLFIANDAKVETILEKLEQNAVYTQTLKVYYPDFNNGRIIYKDNSVSLKTNDNIIGFIENHLKTSPDKDIVNPISQNTKINKLYLDNIEGKVVVDFSKELINEMNAGSGLEADIVQSIVNTLGNYYTVDKVYISVEGNPYESGHISINQNEVFYVDYNNSHEYK
jgi:PBP1b-binding outer membrane lipoprotein LpoB